MLQAKVFTRSLVVRSGLAEMFRGFPEIELVETPEAADVLIFDGEVPDLPEGSPPVLHLTDQPEPPYSRLPRDASAQEIAAALVATAAGLIVIHPSYIQNPGSSPSRLTERLTNREIEVLRMMAEGYGNKIIAGRLGISEHTVKFHVASIFGKLNASSRTEAVAIGARLGLILL